MKNCTYVLRTLLICVFATTGILPAFSQQIEKGLNSSTGDYLGFLEYKPADYNSNTNKYPLIIFLHGIGERGNGTTMLQDVTCCGIPRIIRLGHKMKFTWNGKTETFMVISPQCPEKYGMWPAVFITELINYAKANLRVDPNRIYLTGLSMGGGGTFRFISTGADQPKELAAASTICAPCTFSQPLDPVNAHLPLWSFHATDDPTASVTCTLNAINRINDFNPNPKPLLTIWPTGGHIVWDRVYTDTSYKYDGVVNIYEWFLGQNKSLPVNVMPVSRAGNTITITTGTAAASLDGSASTDADGKLVRYVWRKLSGPAGGVITTPFGPNSSTTVTGLTTAGTYQYQLNVVDDRAAVARDTVNVVVTSGGAVVNIPPVAKAGNDANITLPTNTYTLNGTGSTDQDGTIASYLWTKVSGPAATFVNSAGATTAVNGLVLGTYIFKLRVTDNIGASSEDQLTIVVNAAANVAPVAKAGTDVTITLPTNTVTLNGTGSNDNDGSIASYLWTKVSGPAATIANASGSSTAINNLVEGTYVFKLKVTDNDGASSEDQLTVIVNPAPNVAPVAKAGTDITITLPVNTVTLSGTGSTDNDGTIASYLWTKVSGPPAATIANASGSSTAINNLVEGTYVFKLKVTDNDGASSEDQLTVIVNPAPNVAPVAKAGTDITITLPTNTVTLNGTGSTDNDGTISSYLWTKVSGPPAATIANASGSSTAINNLVEGTYVFKLKVTDNDGASSEDQLTVIVNPAPNVAPVAKAGTDITITLPVNTVTLSGTGSTDNDGSIASYLWTKVSGPAATIANASGSSTAINNLVEGTYVFKLKVTDNDGASSEDQLTVIVNPAPNVAPVAKAGTDITITLPVNSVTVSSTGSADNDGTIASYLWTKVSGPAATIANASGSSTAINNLVEGTYVFKLKVTDNDGASSEDQLTVIVNPAPNVAPVAKAGTDITITLPTNTVTLNGTGSTDNDGSIASYLWTKVSGPAATIANASGSSTAINNLVEGTYVFKLKVTDNDGASSEDQLTVIVNPAPNIAPVAKAGTDITITLPTNSVTLNGTGSTENDGSIASYLWTKVSGPAATIANASGSSTAINNLVEGTYVFKLKVTDNDGASSEDQLTVIVNPAPNVAPVAKAGTDITITLPTNTVTLNGTGSTDNDGSIASYLWTKVSGPAATIANASGSSTAINNLVEGTYVFKLKVTDNDGASSEDQLTVIVNPAPNIAPVAKAGTDITITLPTNSVTLNGTGSTDNDGSIASYLWTKVSGPAATIANASGSSTAINNLAEGTYVFKLKVTDNDGASSEDQLTVIVNPAPNVTPVAKAGTDITITLPTNTVTVNGTGSTDSDGTIASYLWTKVSGPAATIANASGSSTAINNLVEGTYVFKLKVTDNEGASSEDQLRVIVNAAPNVAPVAKAGTDITITLPVNTVTVSGTGSTDNDGTIASYLWTKVSGPAATIANASGSSTAINNLVEGTYVFKLKVTDNDGASSEDQVTVKVNPALNILPDSRAGSDITITLPDNRTSVSGITSTDADGSIVTYAWAKLSGPSQFIIADADAALTSITNLVEGTYTFRLVVTDNDGGTDADTIVITVNAAPPPPNVAPVAQAGENQTITLPVDNVSLNGSGSTDQDGTIATYNWTYLSGPSSYTLNNATSATANVTGMGAGTYSFRLEVEDNNGAVDADTVSIIVEEEAAPPPPPNVAPLAKAGTDFDITLPINQVTLNGEASSDADGSITNYTWKKISGPASLNMVSATETSTIIENLVEGTYLFELQVKDNEGAISNDTVKVTVHPAPNETPASDAGPDMQVQLPDPAIQLNGTDSYDPDGTVDQYKWEQVSGPNASIIQNTSGSTTSVTGVMEGVYLFRLTVTDNDGTRASDVVKVTVLAAEIPNVGPIADAGNDKEITLPDVAIQLDGGKSTDPDGTLDSYSWENVSGPGGSTISNPNGIAPVIAGLEEGEYIFRLTVRDNEGAVASDEVKITVHAADIPNVAPIADAGNDIEATLPDIAIELDGSRSSDPDGTIDFYSWEKVSGPGGSTISNPNGIASVIAGLGEGEYIFRLTVRDNDGEEASDEVKVTVHAAPIPNVAPIADAGNDIEATLPDIAIELDGSRSSDPDGTIDFYSWVKVSGPGGATITNSNGTAPGISEVEAGEYIFRLTVRDNNGEEASDEVKVTIHAAPAPLVNSIPVADAGTDQTISFPDSSSTISGANSNDTDGSISNYEWTMVEGPAPATIVNPASPSTVINNLHTGEYTFVLTVVDDKGAVARDTLLISVINTQRFTEEFKVYPNPAKSHINVHLTNDMLGMTRITIYNAGGTIVQSTNVEKSQPLLLKKMNVGNLQNGIYYLEVIIDGKVRMITKFLKQ